MVPCTMCTHAPSTVLAFSGHFSIFLWTGENDWKTERKKTRFQTKTDTCGRASRFGQVNTLRKLNWLKCNSSCILGNVVWDKIRNKISKENKGTSTETDLGQKTNLLLRRVKSNGVPIRKLQVEKRKQ